MPEIANDFAMKFKTDPLIVVYHEAATWFAECPLAPELNCRSATLRGLLDRLNERAAMLRVVSEDRIGPDPVARLERLVEINRSSSFSESEREMIHDTLQCLIEDLEELRKQ